MANQFHDQLSGADLHDNKVYPATGTPLPSRTQTDARYAPRAHTHADTDLSSFATLDGRYGFKNRVTVGRTGSRADSICDGTNDHTEIQQAVNKVLNGGGGVVDLGPGLFNINGVQTRGDNVTIMGQGPDVTILRAQGGYEMLSFGYNDASIINKNRRVENLTVDMHLIAHAGIYGLVFGARQNVRLTNVFVRNQSAAPAKNQLYFGVGTGSSAQPSRDLIVDKCLFDTNNGSKESFLFAQAKRIKLLNSTVSNVNGQYGLLQYGSYDLQIAGSTFENGADLRLGSQPSQIIGCEFFGANAVLTGSLGLRSRATPSTAGRATGPRASLSRRMCHSIRGG